MGKTTERAIKIRSKILAKTPEKLDILLKKMSEIENRIEELARQLDEKKAQTVLSVSDDLIMTKIFNGLKIFLDPNDIAVVPHIVGDGIWEGNITRAWLTQLEKKKTVFDVGANFGYFGLLAANALNKVGAAKVVMFEANPKLIEYIHRTISVNWFNEVSFIENIAISDTNGKAKLNVLKDYIGCSSLQSSEELKKYLSKKMEVKTHKSVEVDTTTIDEYCRNNSIDEIDLIKLDIEGYEQKAYQGMENMIKSSENMTLFIEFTKDAYEHPEAFFMKMATDFPYLGTIDDKGNICREKNNSYKRIIEQGNDWVMLVFSKNEL